MNEVAKLTRLLWQEQKFKLEVLQSPASQFEDIFSKVMRVAHRGTFHVARPAGKVGDLKCDGWDSATKTLYAVYAPFSVKTKKEIQRKIREDFHGATKHWPAMRRWQMVHNDFFGLSAEVTRELESLRRDAQGSGVDIPADWDPQELWQMARKLPESERFDLLGGPNVEVISAGNNWTREHLRYHEDLHPAVVRAATASLASLCDSYQPDSVLDPLCASALARALTAWWMGDDHLFSECLALLLDRCDAAPFEAQVTSLAFLMRCVEICARRLGVPWNHLVRSQMEEDDLHEPGMIVILEILLENFESESEGGGIDAVSCSARRNLVQGCARWMVDFLGIVWVGEKVPAILTLQDLIVSTQRLDYAGGRLLA